MTSHLLWAHLLPKDVATPSQIPPLAPQDKTATSMRMLIHDTQANLETFSTRLDSLFQRIDDCRTQVVNSNKLLDVERDKVLSEILEISHRCQSELKTHVGVPAQAPALELLRISQAATETSVQALEKRIDALQALVQTHAHAMQSIQDQQNALMSTILPLVPTLHGISPQIDQIKTVLTDAVANAVTAVTNNVESVRSTVVAEIARSSSSQMVGKRSRPHETNLPVSSPLDSGRPKRACIEGRDQLLRTMTRLAALPQTPRMPRQPLADLPLPSSSKTRGCMRQKEAAATDPSTISAQLPRPPFQPLDTRDPTAARGRSLTDDAVKIEDILEVNWTGVISLSCSPLTPSPPPMPRSSLPSNPDTSPLISMSLRDRRAQMSRIGRTETRRFIPLVPWSDEDE